MLTWVKLALRSGLLMAMALGFSDIEAETNSMMLVKAFNSNNCCGRILV